MKHGQIDLINCLSETQLINTSLNYKKYKRSVKSDYTVLIALHATELSKYKTKWKDQPF